MSIAEKLNYVAENIKKVYDAGYAQSESDFWDNFQNKGKRTNYYRAFSRWMTEFIRPKYKVTATDETDYFFSDCTNLKTVEKEYFDFSNMKANFVAYKGPAYAMYNRCNNLELAQDLNIPGTVSYSYTFAFCQKLKTIEIIRTSKESYFSDGFHQCYALENVTFEGVIGQDINISYSTKLSRESLMNIINCLYDYASDGDTAIHKLNLGSANLDKLSDDEQQIATDKGWTLS